MSVLKIAYGILATIAVIYAAWRLQEMHTKVEALWVIVYTLLPQDEEDEEDEDE